MLSDRVCFSVVTEHAPPAVGRWRDEGGRTLLITHFELEGHAQLVGGDGFRCFKNVLDWSPRLAQVSSKVT